MWILYVIDHSYGGGIKGYKLYSPKPTTLALEQEVNDYHVAEGLLEYGEIDPPGLEASVTYRLEPLQRVLDRMLILERKDYASRKELPF